MSDHHQKNALSSTEERRKLRALSDVRPEPHIAVRCKNRMDYFFDAIRVVDNYCDLCLHKQRPGAGLSMVPSLECL